MEALRAWRGIGGPVATLYIENLPDRLYRKLQARAKKGHRSVAQEVTQILELAMTAPEALSIMDLRGLGKELWRDLESARHVAEERETWE